MTDEKRFVKLQELTSKSASRRLVVQLGGMSDEEFDAWVKREEKRRAAWSWCQMSIEPKGPCNG